MKRRSPIRWTIDFCGALALWLLTGTAQAWVTVEPPVAPPAGTVTVTGSHFRPDSPVEVFLRWKRCSVTADAKGQFACAFKVPKSLEPGARSIWTVNRANGRWIRTPFTVGDAVAEWPQYRYSPERAGASPNETVLNPSNVADLSLRWTFSTGSLVHNSVSLAGGVAYFGSFDGYLYAVDGKTGQPVWRVKPAPPGPHCCGTLMNTGSPAVANGKVYIGTIDHYFYAFDQKTGRQLWGIDTKDDLEGTSPTVAGNVVYIGGGCPESDCFNGLRALNAETGAEIWKVKVDRGVATGATVADGVVYVGSGAGNVYALDAATGATLWKTGLGRTQMSLSAALVDDVLYLGSSGGAVYAINTGDGSLLWSATLPTNSFSGPAVQGGTVYIGAGGFLYAFDAESGNVLWSADLGGQVIWSSPTVANGVVYCGSNGGGVVAVAAADGRRLWSALAGQTVHSAPTINDGAVYLGSENGRVYAFDLGISK
ncbi:outer membrane protein assembly factor BamB family protein [Methylotetracoccus oryzae]|uniref:outer membrane protein assembly factor BamB family protein n=1 Tax=Methylotetracoccus oryzae TaxID=1919059 RepID=UPI00111A9472|nr:PQQ-binding-like beta-propeller repeat protein [Methylotetracoccus oryzae]